MARPRLYPRINDTVVIPRGAKVTGGPAEGPRTAGREYKVKVIEFDKADQIVWWIGSGNYYYGTNEWQWPSVLPKARTPKTHTFKAKVEDTSAA